MQNEGLMKLEQIYNDLYNYWNALPEPKVNWEKAFYGGIKDTIERRLTYPLVEKPGLDLRVARILKENLQFGGFNNCEPWEIGLVEEWVHLTFLKDAEVNENSNDKSIKTMGDILRESIND